RKRMFYEFGRLLNGLFVMAGILLSVTFFYRGFSYSRGFTLLFLPCLIALTFGFRIAFRVLRAHFEGLDGFRSRVLLIGDSPMARHLAESTKKDRGPIQVVGVLEDQLPIGTEIAPGVPVFGRVGDLKEIARRESAHGVVITSAQMDPQTQLA